jgi:hypothetical protein
MYGSMSFHRFSFSMLHGVVFVVFKGFLSSLVIFEDCCTIYLYQLLIYLGSHHLILDFHLLQYKLDKSDNITGYRQIYLELG